MHCGAGKGQNRVMHVRPQYEGLEQRRAMGGVREWEWEGRGRNLGEHK